MFGRAVALLALGLCAGTPLPAQTADTLPPPDSATMQAARTLLTTIRIEQDFTVNATRAFAAMRANMGDRFPTEYSERFVAEIQKSAPQLIEATAEVYARYLTKEEIEALTRFYQTPVGQSIVTKQGTINVETMQVGMRLGAEIGKRVQAQMPIRGTPPTPMTTPP